MESRYHFKQWNIISYLQSLLSKYQHQEVNKVSRHEVVEEHTQAVYELVVANVTVGVPQGAFEGILAHRGLADV